MKVYFFLEDCIVKPLHKGKIREIIGIIGSKEKISFGNVNIILCNDEYLREINIKFLDRDYYTDTITFSSCEFKKYSGDIYISVDRIKENSKKFETTFENELVRIIIHSILHIIGYNDNNKQEKETMTKKEDFYLNLF